ncbi:MAG TPA: succinate dehydrogenase, cytochrome b556 subunit [Gammaproteobacteria bacterium]
MDVDRPLSPHLQVYGWRITNTLSILHRAAGLVLTVGAFVLAWWLLAVASGADAYDDARAIVGSGWFKLPLIVFALAFFYHLANGIRHLAWDFGFGFERERIRASGWAVVVVAVAATLVYALLVIV